MLPVAVLSACQGGNSTSSPLSPNGDEDNDKVINSEDAFPYDPTESIDTDNDDIGAITALTSQSYMIDRHDDNDEALVISGNRFLLNKIEISTTCRLYDSDLDGLYDYHEMVIGTQPFYTDCDNDGLSDAVEVETGRNPLDASDGALVDSDNDGVPNGEDPFMDDPTEWLDTNGIGIGIGKSNLHTGRF